MSKDPTGRKTRREESGLGFSDSVSALDPESNHSVSSGWTCHPFSVCNFTKLVAPSEAGLQGAPCLVQDPSCSAYEGGRRSGGWVR
ncbi:hypothetical protein AOLI_G00058490 [Acnodon oligacanthus]